MAGRKNKYTVDYFPHYCNGKESKTMFILENKFGLVGYAVWFKTLELLGKSEYHFIDLRNETDLLFLISKLGISEDKFIEIYDLLAKLDAIDLFLWEKKIIFSDNFVSNIEDAYVRRKGIDVLHKYDLCKHLLIKCEHKLPKKSKVNKNKEYYIKTKEIFNSVCIGLPEVKKITDARKKLIDARIKEYDLETIGNVFKKVSASDFLNGKNKDGWTANFDWIFKTTNFLKILEDNYKNKEGVKEKKDAAQIILEKYEISNT